MSQARRRIAIGDIGDETEVDAYQHNGLVRRDRAHDDAFHLARVSELAMQMGGVLNDVAKALRHVNGRNSVKNWSELPMVAARTVRERDKALTEMAAWQIPEGGTGRVDHHDPRVAAMFAVDRAANKAGRLATPAELLSGADKVDPVRVELKTAHAVLEHVHRMLRLDCNQAMMLRAIETVVDIGTVPSEPVSAS